MNKSILDNFYLIVLLVLIAPITSRAQEQCPVWQPIYLQCRDSHPQDSFDPVAQAECAQRAYETCSEMWTLTPQGEWTVKLGADSGGHMADSGLDGQAGGTREPSAAPGGAQQQAPQAQEPIIVTGSRTITSVDDLRDKLETTCKAKLKQTATCCNDPMSCLVGDGSKDSSGAMMALQIVAGSATQMASISGSCGTLGTVSSAMAAINTGLAFKCTQKISQCNSACGTIAKQAKESARACNSSNGCIAVASDALNECENPKYSDYEKSTCRSRLATQAKQQSKEEARAFTEIASEADQCDNYGGRAVEQQTQAIASMYAAKVAGLCKKQSTTDTANKSNNAFDVNCSDPTNAANPICQNQCNRANAASDPVCAQLLGLGTSGYGNGAGNGLADPNALGGNGSGSIDEFEDPQGMNEPNIAAVANRLGSAGGGGGGGGVPSGASSGGGDGGAAGGGGEGGGLNTDIMGGASSRSGYTNPYVRSSIGGGGGYSAGGGRVPASANGKPFNPRDFLPGGKMDPKRKLAGLAAATPEIGAVHGNIFTNITNRFLQVCLRDGLFDCESVRKNAKPRN